MAERGDTSLFYSARPTLALDGRKMPDLDQGLLALSVRENTEGLSCCEATFGNWGAADGNVSYLYLDRQILDFGRLLAIEMGAGDAAGQVFEGRITAIEGRYPLQRPPEALVLAEDRFQDLRMVRRSRTFEEVSDADVIAQIAGEHGLQSEIDVDGPTYRVLAQVNQSDLAFLRERARAVDAELWMEGSALHVQARARRRTSEVTLTYGKGLREFSVIADLAQQRTALAIGGWDVAAKEEIAQEVTESSIQGELNGGLSGSSLLQQSFGPRPERIVHLVPLSLQEAQALADAHYRQMARRFLCGQGVAEGDGRVRVGSHVRLQGLSPLFDGIYYVYEVRHTFDSKNGYRTYFRVERPWLGEV